MLNDKALKALKAGEKPYKRADEKGLYVLVSKSGARLWRFKYRYEGREKLLALGQYPDTSLKLARQKRDDARRLLAQGLDPAADRQAKKMARADTFEAIAGEWLSSGCPGGKGKAGPSTIAQYRHRLETYAFPHIGKWPIGTIAAPDLLRFLRRIEERGTHETAHRVLSLCRRVLAYAVRTGRSDRNAATDLRGALTPVSTNSFAAITDPVKVGELLRAIDGYQAQPAVMAALKLAPLVFVRPGELRGARWAEISVGGDEPQWVIPASRMKMNLEHVVPLSRQAIAIIEWLRPVTGAGELLFPSLRSRERSISDNTLNAALRSIGYDKTQHVAHGFRSTASTLLHEMGWDSDVIECQLAHARPGVGGIYNRSHRLAERRRMMAAWADYLDGLKAGVKVNGDSGIAPPQ